MYYLAMRNSAVCNMLELEGITLSQMEKDKYYIISLTYEL